MHGRNGYGRYQKGNREMKNNLIDLYREYVRCADMCSEYNEKHRTNIQPRECVEWKSPSYGWLGYPDGNEPDFKKLLDEGVRFAVAILENNPVFVGDIMFEKTTGDKVLISGINPQLIDFARFTLKLPQKRRTFTLNGVELPCPEKEQSEHKVSMHISGSCRPTFPDLRLYFETGGSACDFYNGLRKILLEAKNKE